MASRVYGYQGYRAYQYETTPKKIQPEYKPQEPKKELKKKSTTKVKKKNTVVQTRAKKRKATKEEIKRKATFIAYIVFGFSILFTISYRDSVINEKFNQKESLKAELTEIQKTNEQLEVSLENELNLNSVESMAKDELGMSKLSNSQKIYVDLPKREYVESKVEVISTSEQQSAFQKFIDTITNLFN